VKYWKAMNGPRFALVTGAGRGLGREIASALAEHSAGVAVHYRGDRAAAEESVRRIKEKGAASTVVQADLTREDEAAAAIRDVERVFGRLDILVNNVGPILMKPWAETSVAEWEGMLRANVGCALASMKAALPGMRARGWGRVINIGYSRAEQLVAFPTIAPYAAAKTSLLILTRTAAVSEAGSGVTVNMVSPGLLEESILPSQGKVDRRFVGKFSDVAAAVVFLASEDAHAVTGTNLVVAGAWKM
jgi:3-oxoacyl-[acyl-carrier protein] reductase